MHSAYCVPMLKLLLRDVHEKLNISQKTSHFSERYV